MSSGSDSDPEIEKEEEDIDDNDLTNSMIVEKYRVAAEIANSASCGAAPLACDTARSPPLPQPPSLSGA